jgi:hypothetical protein
VNKEKPQKLVRRRPSDDTDSEQEGRMKKKTPTRKKPSTAEPEEVTNVPTGSRFAPLSDHEDTDLQDEENEPMEEEEETTPEEEKNEKPPPIVLHGKYDYKKLLELSQQSTKHGVSLKFTRANTIIYSQTIKDFDGLKEALKNSKKAEWHTYATKKEKTHGFVAYGLDNNPDENDVKKVLEEKGINCRNVYKMKKTNSPLYVVITDNKTTLQDLESNVKTIDYIIVRWKKLINKREIVQCHNCQTWGHAATNCFAATKCLKCAGNHLTSECSLKKDDTEDQKKIKCSNCGQGHLANSTECEIYIARKKLMEKNRTDLVQKTTRQSNKYVPAPAPTKNAWTTQRIGDEGNRNPAAAHMLTIRARHAEEVAAQSATANNATDPGLMGDVNTFIQICDEVKKLKEKIDLGKLLQSLRTLNEAITENTSTVEIMKVLLSLDQPAFLK